MSTFYPGRHRRLSRRCPFFLQDRELASWILEFRGSIPPEPIMTLDSQTIYVFSTLSLLGIAALVALAASSYPDELRASGRLWSGATLVLGLGMAAIALRGYLPSTLSVLAAHTLGIAGLSGLHHALTRFAGGRVRLYALYAPVWIAAASSTYFLLVQPNYAWRVAVFSLIGAAQLSGCCAVAWRLRGSEAPMTARVAAAGFASGAGLLLVRVVETLTLTGSATPDAVFRSSTLEQAIVLGLSLDFLLFGVTFVLLCNERLNSVLRRQALVDPLTESLNRRGITAQVSREVARARRSDLPLSVALLDLDNLKAINDTEGHALGDVALLCVARSLARGLRTQDTFGRWGGDEFLVVLPDTDLVGAEEACERVRTLVAESGRAGPDGVPRCSVSIGIACRRGAEVDLDRLVMEADRALYASKQSGRNAVWSAQPAVPHPVVPGRVSSSLVLPVSLGSPES